MKSANVVLKAQSPAYGGLAIGRMDGKVVMIKGAIPGETVEVSITKDKKDYSEATVERVIEPSEDRCVPPCRYFGTCGGCQLQYIRYDRQVSIKEDVLKDCLKRIAGLDVTLSEPLSGEPYNYRHRGQFKAAQGKLGLYREKSHEVVDIESCPLMVAEVNEGLATLRRVLKGAVYSEAHIVHGESTLALIKGARSDSANWGRLIGKHGGGFAGVYVESTDKGPIKLGLEYITLDLDGLQYTVSPTSFFQGHWRLNQSVVKLIIQALQPLEGKRVLDLYAGAGNFALPLALHARGVTAVEEVPSAVNDGKRNARINGIKNCKFIRTNVDSLRTTDRVDILIADPPREGLSPAALDKALLLKPEKIAYVSCNPASLSRDIKKLGGQYELESIRMVDFFPQTYHIESVSFLKRKV